MFSTQDPEILIKPTIESLGIGEMDNESIVDQSTEDNEVMDEQNLQKDLPPVIRMILNGKTVHNTTMDNINSQHESESIVIL